MKLQYLAIEGSAKDKEDAIRMCGEMLFKNGLVMDEFSYRCILREEEFPTGLPTDIPVAIPHCGCESVLKDSICFLRLDKPVKFHRMDDEQEYIMTDMIFNIAIKDSDNHVNVLSNLIKFITDSKNLDVCRSINIEDVPDYLQKNIE